MCSQYDSRIKILSINILILKPWKEFFLCLPSIANRAHDYTLDNIFYFLINWMELKLISSWIYFVTQCFYNFLPSASIQGKQKLTRISLLLLFLSYCRCYSRRIKMIRHFLAVAHTKLIFDLRWRKKREIIFSNNGVGLSVCLFCYIGCLDNCMAAKIPNLRLPKQLRVRMDLISACSLLSFSFRCFTFLLCKAYVKQIDRFDFVGERDASPGIKNTQNNIAKNAAENQWWTSPLDRGTLQVCVFDVICMRFSRIRCFCLFHFILFAYIYNIHHTVSETERDMHTHEYCLFSCMPALLPFVCIHSSFVY